jgi:hypothetical protein
MSQRSAQPSPMKRRLIVVPALIAVGLTAAACDGDDGGSTSAATSSSTSSAPSSSAPAPVAPSTTAPAPTSDAGVNFAMPNLVGLDLQTAQNEVQDYGVFLSVSHDLRGSRNQAVDSNWIVCDQNIAPGQQVTGDAEGAIDFGVVKREESCP